LNTSEQGLAPMGSQPGKNRISFNTFVDNASPLKIQSSSGLISARNPGSLPWSSMMMMGQSGSSLLLETSHLLPTFWSSYDKDSEIGYNDSEQLCSYPNYLLPYVWDILDMRTSSCRSRSLSSLHSATGTPYYQASHHPSSAQHQPPTEKRGRSHTRSPLIPF
jgi:hypothetical protein